MTAVSKIEAPGIVSPPGASWSNCLLINREVVFSGVTARGADGITAGGNSMEDQTRACMEKIFSQLEAAGGHPGNIYRLVVYITDMSRKDEVNIVRKELFEEIYPASTLIGVSELVFPDLLVEIDAFANLDISLHQDASK